MSPRERDALARLELDPHLLALGAVGGAHHDPEWPPVVGDGYTDLVPDADVVHLALAIGILHDDPSPRIEPILEDGPRELRARVAARRHVDPDVTREMILLAVT